MIKNNVLKGVFLVGLGATSYGMLATFVKLAYSKTGITGNPFTSAEIIGSQFILGITAMLIINAIQRMKKGEAVVKATSKNIRNLMIAGTSTGLTSIFYYLAVKYIPVSIGIVMLMQTVWMGVLLEMVLDKKLPSKIKVIAVAVVLLGTALATNLLSKSFDVDYRGIILGMMAAASFTATMFTANRIATEISSAQKSLYMLLGGAVIVTVFVFYTQVTPINYDIFWKWGIVLALFGTVIPPVLLNAGFPLTGIGLGSIVSALELPVSVLMAYFVLNETVVATQWLGICLIIAAIVLMNVKFKKD